MTKLEKRLLLDLLNGSSLHTSSHPRQYVRLSGKGLVDLAESFLHRYEVRLTEKGRAEVDRIGREQAPALRVEALAHAAYQRRYYGKGVDVQNSRGKWVKVPLCHCGGCAFVRQLDREFRSKSLAAFRRTA